MIRTETITIPAAVPPSTPQVAGAFGFRWKPEAGTLPPDQRIVARALYANGRSELLTLSAGVWYASGRSPFVEVRLHTPGAVAAQVELDVSYDFDAGALPAPLAPPAVQLDVRTLANGARNETLTFQRPPAMRQGRLYYATDCTAVGFYRHRWLADDGSILYDAGAAFGFGPSVKIGLLMACGLGSPLPAASAMAPNVVPSVEMAIAAPLSPSIILSGNFTGGTFVKLWAAWSR